MNRIDAVSQAFLQWSYQNRRTSPPNHGFLTNRESLVNGQQVTPDELEDVVELLHQRGLVDGPVSFGEPQPNPAELTPDGFSCVLDYDADVQKWKASRLVTYVNQPVTVTGNQNQVSAFSSNISQQQRSTMEKVHTLRNVAEQALAGLGTYEIDEDEAADVRAAAEKVLAETAEGEPEPGRIAKLAKKLHSVLSMFLGTAVGAEFAQRLMDALLPLIGMAA